MAQLPLTSIVIRTMNRPKMLVEALRSVALQTYPAVEAIIVNDGGESLKDILNNLDFKCDFCLIEFEKNKGRCEAANAGIENARGEYLGFLDDDDILYPEHIQILLNEFSAEDAVVYSDALQAFQNPIENGSGYKTFKFNLAYSEEHSLKRMLEGNFIPFQCLLFRRSLLIKERLDPSLQVLEDWDLLIRLSKQYQFKHIKKITSEFRLRMDYSNTTGSMPVVWENTRKILNQRYKELALTYNLKKIPIK